MAAQLVVLECIKQEGLELQLCRQTLSCAFRAGRSIPRQATANRKFSVQQLALKHSLNVIIFLTSSESGIIGIGKSHPCAVKQLKSSILLVVVKSRDKCCRRRAHPGEAPL